MKRSNRSEDLLDCVAEIDMCGENLTEWEVDFIANLIDNPPNEVSEKQEEIITRIYSQRVQNA